MSLKIGHVLPAVPSRDWDKAITGTCNSLANFELA